MGNCKKVSLQKSTNFNFAGRLYNGVRAKIDGEWKEKGKYIGEVNNENIPHGEGVFTSQWGQIYTGTFREGMCEGFLIWQLFEEYDEPEYSNMIGFGEC